MSKATQWFYASTAPRLKTANLPSPEVTYPTFQAKFGSEAKRHSADVEPTSVKDMVNAIKASGTKTPARHKPGKFKLPEELVSEKALLEVKRTWKAAGYKSNRVGAAAVFYLMEDSASEWKNANNVWAGLVFIKLGFDSKICCIRLYHMVFTRSLI